PPSPWRPAGRPSVPQNGRWVNAAAEAAPGDRPHAARSPAHCREQTAPVAGRAPGGVVAWTLACRRVAPCRGEAARLRDGPVMARAWRFAGVVVGERDLQGMLCDARTGRAPAAAV